MAAFIPPGVEGPGLCLRPVRSDDAAYIHGLRVNPAYNRHLSAVTGTVDDQRAWIERYRTREAAGQEIYYLITRKDDTPCGTVRLYDIAGDRFTWGSWILDHNKPAKAALESAVLSFDVGFGALDKTIADIDVRKDNIGAIRFYRRYGAIETHADDLNLYFTLDKATHLANRTGHLAVLGQ